MKIRNAAVYNENYVPVREDIEIDGGIIKAVGIPSGSDGLDFSGLTLLPGFIDIHTHGAMMADCSSGKAEDIQTVSRFLARSGITSFCPTTMTLPLSELERSFAAIDECIGREQGAYIHGVNMEGPYISYAKKGAQAADHIRKPDFDEFLTLNAICPIKLVDVAPEVEGAVEFAKRASKVCTVSAAHTNASYEQALDGFKNGFTHATHLFNAMSPIVNRAPGAVIAALECENVNAELICDGHHNHPAILRAAFRLLGSNRAVVISDAMCAAGMGDGEYTLGGQTVYVKNSKAALADGTVAASTTNLFEEFKYLLRFGIPFEQALRACTVNPARAIGVDGVTGTISTGKRADLLAVDDQLNLKAVFIKGTKVL